MTGSFKVVFGGLARLYIIRQSQWTELLPSLCLKGWTNTIRSS